MSRTSLLLQMLILGFAEADYVFLVTRSVDTTQTGVGPFYHPRGQTIDIVLPPFDLIFSVPRAFFRASGVGFDAVR